MLYHDSVEDSCMHLIAALHLVSGSDEPITLQFNNHPTEVRISPIADSIHHLFMFAPRFHCAYQIVVG